ncbi:MAG: hypothetical protein AB8B58_07910 [Roseobacter sp.]
MFKPFRTLILIGAAFLAGVFFERGTQREACFAQGGDYAAGLCTKGSE